MSVQVAEYSIGSIRELVFEIVAGPSGEVPPVAVPPITRGVILALLTEPSVPVPSDCINVRLIDANGADALQDCGLCRSGREAQYVTVLFTPKHSATSALGMFADLSALTLHITGNSVPNARITVRVRVVTN